MKSTGRLHLQRNIRPAAGSDGPMKRLGVDLHNQIGFKGHKYDVRSSSFESSGKVLPWTGWTSETWNECSDDLCHKVITYRDI